MERDPLPLLACLLVALGLLAGIRAGGFGGTPTQSSNFCPIMLTNLQN